MVTVDSSSVERMLGCRGATGVCSSCGRNEWLTLPVGITVELPVSESAGTASDVVALACSHCGSLRLHVEPAIALDPSIP